MKAKWQSYSKGRIGVYSRNIPEPYVVSVRNILSAARRCLAVSFGLPTPGHLEVIMIKNGKSSPRLGTNGKDSIFLVVSKTRDLKAPKKSGIHHVYGLCHELAHIAMYRRIRNVYSLPPGWGEGWAHYAASTALVPYVWKRLGEDAWPDPYPYVKTEGKQRFLGQISRAGSLSDHTLEAAAKLYMIESKKGRKQIGHMLWRSEARGLTGDSLVLLLEKML